jgi:hypothetical protein
MMPSAISWAQTRWALTPTGGRCEAHDGIEAGARVERQRGEDHDVDIARERSCSDSRSGVFMSPGGTTDLLVTEPPA